jgi:hypothetical protein
MGPCNEAHTPPNDWSMPLPLSPLGTLPSPTSRSATKPPLDPATGLARSAAGQHEIAVLESTGAICVLLGAINAVPSQPSARRHRARE